MKNIILSIILILATTITKAQESNKSAKALVKCIYTDKSIDKMVDNYQNYFKQIALKAYKNEKDTSFLNFMHFSLEKVKVMMRQMVEEDLPGIYSKIFSKNELDELTKFYNSETGKKYLSLAPEVSKSVQNLILEKYMPKIQKDMEERLKESKSDIK